MNFEEFTADVSDIRNELAKFITEKEAHISDISKKIINFDPQYIMISGHGSSKSASKYILFVLREKFKIPTFLVEPQDLSHNHIFPNRRTLVILISKTGETRDVVSAAIDLKKYCDCMVVSITNDTKSTLASCTNYNIDLNGTVERCAAFSKSHVLTMMAGLALGSFYCKKNVESIQYFIEFLSRNSLNFFNCQDLKKLKKYRAMTIISEGIGLANSMELSIKVNEMYRNQAEVCTARSFWHAADSYIFPDDLIIFIHNDDRCKSIVEKIFKTTSVLKISSICLFPDYRLMNEEIKETWDLLYPIAFSIELYENLPSFNPWTPYETLTFE